MIGKLTHESGYTGILVECAEQGVAVYSSTFIFYCFSFSFIN